MYHPILPTHTHTHIEKSPKLPSCDHWIMPSLCLHHLTRHRTTWTWWYIPLSTNSASRWNAAISCRKTAPSSQYMATLHNTQGWKEPTTRSQWNCRGTTHNNIPSTAKIRPGHGANKHTFAKGAIRSASSTQCLETQTHTLSPRYTATQSLL